MRRRIAAIVLGLLLAVSGMSINLANVPCGSTITVSATPYEGFHFVGWSDGSKESTRVVEIYSDTVLIAFFDSNCGIYEDLPIVIRYDWLLMVNAKAVREMGYEVSEELVEWYRVVGEPDLVGDRFAEENDDELVCRGLYLTIDQNLAGTGDYYYVLRGAIASNGYCNGAMRSSIAHYAGEDPEPETVIPRIAQPLVGHGCSVEIIDLPTDVQTDIRVYSVSGQLLKVCSSYGQDRVAISDVAYVQGCYEVCLSIEDELYTLRYLVK